MRHCQARLSTHLRATANGWPEWIYDTCGQVVGVTSWTDLLGRKRAACSLPWHRIDVEQQQASDEAMERARHDWEADQRPVVAPVELAADCGRPEMARLVR